MSSQRCFLFKPNSFQGTETNQSCLDISGPKQIEVGQHQLGCACADSRSSSGSSNIHCGGSGWGFHMAPPLAQCRAQILPSEAPFCAAATGGKLVNWRPCQEKVGASEFLSALVTCQDERRGGEQFRGEGEQRAVVSGLRYRSPGLVLRALTGLRENISLPSGHRMGRSHSERRRCFQQNGSLVEGGSALSVAKAILVLILPCLGPSSPVARLGFFGVIIFPGTRCCGFDFFHSHRLPSQFLVFLIDLSPPFVNINAAVIFCPGGPYFSVSLIDCDPASSSFKFGKTLKHMYVLSISAHCGPHPFTLNLYYNII